MNMNKVKYVMTIDFLPNKLEVKEVWSNEVPLKPKHLEGVNAEKQFHYGIDVDETENYNSYAFAWVIYDTDTISESDKLITQQKVKTKCNQLVYDYFIEKQRKITDIINNLKKEVEPVIDDAELINSDSEIYNQRYIN